MNTEMNKMKKAELIMLAKAMGVTLTSKLKKGEIIELIEEKKNYLARNKATILDEVTEQEAKEAQESFKLETVVAEAKILAPVVPVIKNTGTVAETVAETVEETEVVKALPQNKCQKVVEMLEAGKPVYLAKGNDLVVRVTRLDKVMFKGYFPNNPKVEGFTMRWSTLLGNEWEIVNGSKAKFIANCMRKKSYNKFKNENLNKNQSGAPYMEGQHRYMVNSDPRSGEAVVIDRNNMTVHKCSYGKGYKNLVTKAGIDTAKAKTLVDSGEFAKVMLGAIRK